MSVYIRGMAAPQSCNDCPVSGILCCPLMPGVPSMVAEYDSAIKENRLHSNCPLLPVPEHGRLIDANALTYVMGMDERFSVLEAMYLMGVIANAPTIIPADKEGK